MSIPPEFQPVARAGSRRRIAGSSNSRCTVTPKELCFLLAFLIPNFLVLRSLWKMHLEILPKAIPAATSWLQSKHRFEYMFASVLPLCDLHRVPTCQSISKGNIVHPASPMSAVIEDPDFAGLDYVPLNDTIKFELGRRIPKMDDKRYHIRRNNQLQKIDDKTSSWDAAFEFYEEQSYPSKDNCYRPKWTYDNHPSCNTFHETVLLERPVGVAQQTFDVSFLGRGFFRLSFLFDDVTSNDRNFVLKPMRFAPAHGFDPYTFDTVQLEALSMDRSSASHRTIDIYGHCAASVLIEPGEEAYQKLRPRKVFIKHDKLDRTHPSHVLSYNNLTSVEKLLVSLAMAEGLAEQHGRTEGALVNCDVQIQQFLVTKSGQIKLNDFNNVRPLKWNPIQQRYCPYRTNFKLLYRSPEERTRQPTDESSDVYALGQVMYTILTGMYPFYETGSYEEALRLNKLGAIPYIDVRYRNATIHPIEHQLVDLMESTWAINRFERPSIFTVVRTLRNMVYTYEQQHHLSLSNYSFRSLVERGS